MKISRPVSALLAAVLLCGSSADTPAHDAGEVEDGSPREQPDLTRFFGSIRGTFVLKNPRASTSIYHDEARARTRFLPASTFKIPNTLIALGAGVVDGPDLPLRWDSVASPSEPWWPGGWRQDQTLRTALPNSVVWYYYQELARRVGPEQMQRCLDSLQYGNGELSGGIDQLWLSGGLRISSVEQVDFLKRFYLGRLGLPDAVTTITKELLVMGETERYRLSGKTGWAGLGDSSPRQIGWLVGYLDLGDQRLDPGLVVCYPAHFGVAVNRHV